MADFIQTQRQAVSRGIALGLWILAGLAFLTSAVLPGSAVGHLAGSVLLAVTVGWTAVAVRRGEGVRSSGVQLLTPSQLPRFYALTLFGALVALVIAVTVVRTGDRRSFLFAAFAALCAVVIGWRRRDD